MQPPQRNLSGGLLRSSCGCRVLFPCTASLGLGMSRAWDSWEPRSRGVGQSNGKMGHDGQGLGHPTCAALRMGSRAASGQ